MAAPSQTHFGDRTVDLDEKPGLVRSLFTDVAGSYDLMNDLMSFGVHRAWKDALITWVRPRAGQRFLDLAGGTGDIAFRLARAVKGQQGALTVCDFTPAMLAEGEKRATQRSALGPISWVVGDAMDLPFAKGSFDVVTLGFGLRNVATPERALREVHRVLAPGGLFFCLEFSHVVLPLLDRAYDAFSFRVIPRLGQGIAGDRDAYQYLVQSIRQFPDQETLAAMMADAGFARVRHQNLSGGIAALHRGVRL